MFFKINNKLAIGAEYYQTRYSWGHKAHLYWVQTPERSDDLIMSDKITYYNRTWERFQFESILYHVVGKAFKKHLITENEYKICNDYIKAYEPGSPFGQVANIAALGDIFGSNQKEKNDWKARMLKAGLPAGSLTMPDDWDTLTEDEKEKRLNGAIQQLK